jgi:hypothetical protein
MSAVDGSFNSPTEAVEAMVSTGALTFGRHILFVRGRGVNDYQGYQSWGPISAAFLDVIPGGGTPLPTSTSTNTPVPPTVTLTSTPANTSTGTVTAVATATSTSTEVSTATSTAEVGTATPTTTALTPEPTSTATSTTTACAITFTAKIVILAFGYDIYIPPTAPTFVDVPADHPFYDFVETAAYNNIVAGYDDETFRPFNNVTRGQLSKIVVIAAGWSLLNPPTPTFTDVDQTNPFYSEIETAYCHQIISGYDDGTFRPFNDATRGQISKITYLAVIDDGTACEEPPVPTATP